MVENDIPPSQVAFIISSTAIRTEDDFEDVINHYSKTDRSWILNQDNARRIATELWRSGKIFQPRLTNLSEPAAKNSWEIWHTEETAVSLLKAMGH
jgi:hypothetical protein